MTAVRPRLRALIVGAAAIALVTIGAGGTLAASTPTVYACYNVNGQVAFASVAQCKLAGGGQLVQINAAGVPGPTGPAGATGATGATGPTGPTGPDLVSTATACSTGAYSTSVSFGPDGRLYCGVGLTIAVEAPYVAPAGMRAYLVDGQGLAGFGTYLGGVSCGGPSTVGLPCSGVVGSVSTSVFVLNYVLDGLFRLRCPDGTIALPVRLDAWYAHCDFTPTAPATVTILAPAP